MIGFRSILKLAGKGESKVAAVFGFTPESCHRAVLHLRKGAPEVPVWLFATSDPTPETVALCRLVLVRPDRLALVRDAYRLLWPFWVALSVAPWTGGHGGWSLKLVPFIIPPFRVLLQNRHGDFFPGTPAAILRHLGRLSRDAAHDAWNAIRTWSHAAGDVCRDQGHWLAGSAMYLRLLLLLGIGTLLRWLFRQHCRLFQNLHGEQSLSFPETPSSGEGIALFQPTGVRWDGEKLERLARSSTARWILWHEGPASADSAGDLRGLFDDASTFAVSRQSHFRDWKPMVLPTAPFRTLQPGERSRVLAPISDIVLVDRQKLLSLGIPHTTFAKTGWMLLFWKAAAAGWRCFSVGQDKKLSEQPDFPVQETAFLAHLLADSSLRRLGPREPELSRGCIASARPRARDASPRHKVLLVTPFLPYPLSHGGAVRIFNLCRALSGRVDFTLIAIREKNEFVDYERLGEIFGEVHVVDIDERASKDPRLPAQVRGHQSGAMRALIADVARRWRPDILQVEYTHMASFRDAAPEVPAVLVEHDLTFSLYRQLAAKNPTPAAEAEYQRWLSFEQQWLRSYEGVWTVCEEDRRVVLRDTGRSAGHTFTVPNGVDIQRFSPGDQPAQHPEIFYVGSFRHLPNILGFQKLRQEVMPRVWKRFPEARLRVVAGPRHEQYWRDPAPPDPRIEVHGFVEDLRPLYAGALIVAVPLEVSAGTNIKVLEAMACGKPVVTTPLGCAGLDLVDGVDAVIRQEWDAFAHAACDLLADPALSATIAGNARRSAERRFSWTAIAEAAFASYVTLANAALPGRQNTENP